MMNSSRKRIGTRFKAVFGVLAMVMVITLLALPAGKAHAMPNLARQYGAGCSTCHTIVPRLNRTGYEFRRAGFRNPDEIGTLRELDGEREDDSFKVSNYFSARLQMNASYTAKDKGNNQGHDSVFKNLFKEFTLYPLTGGFLKNWASMSEISGGTDEIEVENAYLRYTAGTEKSFWEFRGGIFHPFEGFGASDRPLGLSRPMIQSMKTMNSNGDVNGWHPWGYDQAGLEAGYSNAGFSLSVAAFNGLIENADDPAQGGKLRKDPDSPTYKDMDYQVFANQFIGSSNAAVSAYYYNGRISLGDPNNLARNDFYKYAAYLTVPFGTWRVMGAFSGGRDTYTPTDTSVDNMGWFAEVDNYVNERLGVGARFDFFDPDTDTDNNNVTGVTAFVNRPLNTGVQFILEYKYTQQQHGVDPDTKDHALNLRAIYIF